MSHKCDIRIQHITANKVQYTPVIDGYTYAVHIRQKFSGIIRSLNYKRIRS